VRHFTATVVALNSGTAIGAGGSVQIALFSTHFVLCCLFKTVQVYKISWGVKLNDDKRGPSRKPYRPPAFRVYGDIRAMTQMGRMISPKADSMEYY